MKFQPPRMFERPPGAAQRPPKLQPGEALERPVRAVNRPPKCRGERGASAAIRGGV